MRALRVGYAGLAASLLLAIFQDGELSSADINANLIGTFFVNLLGFGATSLAVGSIVAAPAIGIALTIAFSIAVSLLIAALSILLAELLFSYNWSKRTKVESYV